MAEWPLRRVADHLARRYRDEGLWTDDTLGRLVGSGIAQHRELTVRVWSDTRPGETTLGEVGRRATALAGGLRSRGIEPGDVVAFQLPNWVEAAVTFYGVALAGGVLVPIVHFYGPRELGHILRETGARALITADRFGRLDYLAGLEAVRPGLPALETVAVVGSSTLPANAMRFDALEAEGKPLRSPTAVDPDSAAVVGYTSGTTAKPKGVIHTHRSLTAELRQVMGMGAQGGRPSIVGAPVGHAIGMQAGLLLPVLRGLSIHLTDVWDPPSVLQAMLEAELTGGSGATYFLQSLLDDPVCTPRHHELIGQVGLGGAAVPPAVADRAEALGISIVRSYGSTEHPSTTGSTHSDPHKIRCYTDGRPLPGVEVRIVDDAGRDVAQGEAGEILSRGPDLFLGYTDPELAGAVDTDGWYATGDIGVLDRDGALTITDRKKDIIIRGGENVSAAEIEELLIRLPGVAEVAVVAAPDARLGEHACAFVRGAVGAETPGLEAVRHYLDRAGLARQKWPEELRVVDDFPRTASGKVKKFVLRDHLRAESAGG
jgi:acyl-CoA synthetase